MEPELDAEYTEEEIAEVFESGEALDGGGLEADPDEDHEGRVRDSEVCVQERLAIAAVAVEVFEGWGRWDYKEATLAHVVDCGFC